MRFLSVQPRMRNGWNRCGNALPTGDSWICRDLPLSPDCGVPGYLSDAPRDALGGPHQTIEMAADMSRLGRRIGQCNGAVKGRTCLGEAAQLRQECAARPEKIVVAGQSLLQRRDH